MQAGKVGGEIGNVTIVTTEREARENPEKAE